MNSVLSRRHLFAINASSIAALGAGFLNTLLVPRLAIAAMGVEHYGLYALLLGYCLIPTAMDLGVVPGLTRELGALAAKGRLGEARVLLARIRGWLSAGGFLVAGGVAGAVALSSKMGPDGVWPVLLGASSNALVLSTELGLLKIRVSGRIISANLARCLYFGTYIGGVAALSATGHLTLTGLFGCQLFGASIYATGAWLLTRNLWAEPCGAAVPIPWKRLLHAATPEQMNRAQSALLPGIERSLMFAQAGGVFVGAYDVALRMSALVTSAPAALSEPLIALLSSRQDDTHDAQRRMILGHAVQLTFLTLVGTLGVTALFVRYFALDYYRLAGTSFLPITALVVAGSAVNVLTAPVVAQLYASGRPGLVIAKTSGDLLLAAVALGAGWWTRSPMTYLAIRYGGYFLTATGLVIVARVKRTT